MTSIARIVSLTVLATIMVFLGISFFHVVSPFLMPLFLAAVAAILCQPLFRYFMMWTSDRTRVSAGLTTMTILFLIMFPIIVGVTTATVEIYTFAHVTIKKDQWKKDTGDFVRRILPNGLENMMHPVLGSFYGKEKKGIQEPLIKEKIKNESDKADRPNEENKQETKEPIANSEKNNEDSETGQTETEEKPEENKELTEEEKIEEEKRIEKQVTEIVDTMGDNIGSALLGVAQRSAGFAGAAITGIIGAFVASVVGLIMFIVALYYFLADGPAMLVATEKMIPVHIPYQKEIIHRFEITVRSVVFATMLSAIAQGVATSFMLSMVVETPFFILFIVATVASLIPMAGAWLVWGPYALGLIFQTEPQWGAAITLILVGGVLIGTMDNVIKTFVLQNSIRLHPLLALVSVLGGIQAMGLWGVFIGPIVASCLYALVRIFNTELKELSEVQSLKKKQKKLKKQAAKSGKKLKVSPDDDPESDQADHGESEPENIHGNDAENNATNTESEKTDPKSKGKQKKPKS